MKDKKPTPHMPQKAHRQSVNHPWSVQARAKAAEKKQKEKSNDKN
tara:strand:+ start:865 stop:999 length:135 start_codon:yes stop_codon:yes gene_type:complete